MSNAHAERVQEFTPDNDEALKTRRVLWGNRPTILTEIYQEETNIVIWKRELSRALNVRIEEFVVSNPSFQTAMTITAQSALRSLREYVGRSELSEDIAELVGMFCHLLGLKQAGLRLAVLDRAMCPKFHVDHVPCRLLSTYCGVATEWLPHAEVDRSKLGPKSEWKSDLDSGLFKSAGDIRHLDCGDVALLKGERWGGNEKAGLVHRSPEVPEGQSRLVLTLDVA
ncbi:MAG: DUF1826 domain-containing protein [Pseudomonadota bacterium]